MADIPQPASEPYERGQTVTIHIAEDDPDAQFHGLTCVVVDRFADQLNTETGREIDQYTYRLKRRDTNELVPVEFRHRDLVPTPDAGEE